MITVRFIFTETQEREIRRTYFVDGAEGRVQTAHALLAAAARDYLTAAARSLTSPQRKALLRCAARGKVVAGRTYHAGSINALSARGLVRLLTRDYVAAEITPLGHRVAEVLGNEP